VVEANEMSDKGCTALMIAINWGQNEIAQSLLIAKADVDVKRSDDWTALHFATLRSSTHIASRLILSSNNIGFVNEITGQGFSPLFLAAGTGNVVMVNLLLLKGAQIDFSQGFGITALMEATRLGHIGVMKALIMAGADLQKVCSTPRKMTASHFAVESGFVVAAKLLLRSCATVDDGIGFGYTILEHAIKSSQLQMALFLLRHGASFGKALVEHTNLDRREKDVLRRMVRSLWRPTTDEILKTGVVPVRDLCEIISAYLFS